jgi:gamma-glutamyltranspeptidase/glutathione hydrolase
MNYERIVAPLIATAFLFNHTFAQAASQAPAAAENGMVVTAQHLATHVGVTS